MIAALAAAPVAARGAEVSAELRRALAAGASRVPVVVMLRPSAADARRPAVSSSDLAGAGLTSVRRFANAPVVSGVATGAAVGALAALPGVAHVGLDREVRPAGQVGVAQVGADRLLGIGVTGLGRSIALVDTGIDLQHPDLQPPGGGAWPGANLADGDGGDLADCSGHGTEVAGILAGPQGIAPDVGLVVLKVFSARDGCKVAHASDVLAAVDWAVSHAPGSNLEAVNMSLADDSLHPGFCDADDPAGAALLGAARDAGLSVVAAAGNEGRTNGLPWPACLSGVASVGMVYSLSSGPVAWGGVASCTDMFTGPDVVPCASNSSSALAALAPGVDWTTTAAGGGQSSGFSGTSAAAPAAAGALVLARQARPLADPALALDLLRATGAPVRDARSGRTSPRLDLGAALSAPSPSAGACADAAIPDAPADGVTCDAVVSSLVGNVSTLTVAVALDHPDASQLVVTLTGPDGTRATLMNRDRRTGEAVREVFGVTSAAREPLSVFAGHPIEGTWRLTVSDAVAGGTGRLVGWALFAEPAPSETQPAFTGATSFVATAAHHFGKLGSFFTTDLRLFNTDPVNAQSVTLRFSPAEEGFPPRTIALTLPPLGTRVLDDVIRNAFRTQGYGPLFLAAAPSVLAVSRTATTAPRGGSFGLAIPARPATAAAAAAGDTLTLIPLFEAEGFRLNVGVTEVSGAPATVEIALRGPAGALRALVRQAVPALGLVQVNDIYGMTSLAPDPADRVEVRVTGGAGRVAAWATAVDASSNDGSFVAAQASAPSLLIPAVAHASGAYGARFVTDLKLSNAGAGPLRVRIAFAPTSGTAPDAVVVTLAGNETRVYDDVLGTLFAAQDDQAGTLRLAALDPGGLFATTRTATSTGGKSFGLAVDPVGPSALAGPGGRLALTFLSSSSARRTNVGFVETSGVATHLRATLVAPDGSVAVTRDVSLAAFESAQWNDVFAAMNAAPLPEASLLVDVLDGGTVTAYGILLDNRTNDGSYFPAALVPAPATAP